jgi:4-amino-4-deoxy-L-arabinose transferase-like glycosyltransferase
MPNNPASRIMPRLKSLLLDKYHLMLCGVLAVAAYLRLWNLTGLFNAVHDYDEGVYSLAGRFISQGFVPYRDFLLAHPPLHNLMLAAVYRIFGYNFFYGKILSVILSLAAVVLVYIIVKRLFNRQAGLLAASIMAISPDMVYIGRRVVQEPLGILLILLAIYMAIGYFSRPRLSRLVWCGLFLGLAAATKYIFIPAALAIIIFIILFKMGPRFRESLKALGGSRFWVTFLGLAGVVFAVLLMLRWVFYLDIAIPFLTLPPFGSQLAVPLPCSYAFFIALAAQARPGWAREWWQAFISVLQKKDIWVLGAGVLAGFFAVTGYFLITTPGDFIHQTFFMQQERPYLEFPSLVTMLRAAPVASGFLKMAYLPILGSIPLAIIILRRNSLSLGQAFIAWGIVISLGMSQFFYHLPRYYIAVFAFFVLGVASFMPELDAGLLKSKLSQIPSAILRRLLAIGALLAIFISLTVTLLTNYTGYDINGPFYSSVEKYVYNETISYLEQAGARKVYAANPIYPALGKELNSTLSITLRPDMAVGETPRTLS